jgi:hypothetical protein
MNKKITRRRLALHKVHPRRFKPRTFSLQQLDHQGPGDVLLPFELDLDYLDGAEDLLYQSHVHPVVVAEVVDVGGNNRIARGVSLENQSVLVCTKGGNVCVQAPPPGLDNRLDH